MVLLRLLLNAFRSRITFQSMSPHCFFPSNLLVFTSSITVIGIYIFFTMHSCYITLFRSWTFMHVLSLLCQLYLFVLAFCLIGINVMIIRVEVSWDSQWPRKESFFVPSLHSSLLCPIGRSSQYLSEITQLWHSGSKGWSKERGYGHRNVGLVRQIGERASFGIPWSLSPFLHGQNILWFSLLFCTRSAKKRRGHNNPTNVGIVGLSPLSLLSHLHPISNPPHVLKKDLQSLDPRHYSLDLRRIY